MKTLAVLFCCFGFWGLWKLALYMNFDGRPAAIQTVKYSIAGFIFLVFGVTLCVFCAKYLP